MTKAPQGSLLIAIGGENLFGAERRVIRLAATVARLAPHYRIILVLSAQLYATARSNPVIGKLVSSFESRDCLVVLPGVRPFRRGRRLGLLAAQIRAGSPIFSSYGTDRFLIALRFLGIPFTYEVTSPAVVDRIARRNRTWLPRAAKSFLCVSPSVAKKLQDFFASKGIDASAKISSYPSPYLDPEVFQDDPKSKVIVIGSRFAERKNVHVFAQALVTALPQLSGWSVKICGNGPFEEQIRATLAEHIAAGTVEVGYVPNLSVELRSSQVFVSMIEKDNYPSQSVIEAMGAGNALLLSDRGDSHRFIDCADPNGTLVEIDPPAIARALVDLCLSAHLSEMGASSRRHLSYLCDERDYVETLLRSCGYNLANHGG